MDEKKLTRRKAIQCSLEAAASLSLGSAAISGCNNSTRSSLLPVEHEAPNLSSDKVKKYISCVRPFREKGFRLEVEAKWEKTLVHNYGHGGGGITVSWGCAKQVLKLVDSVGIDAGSEVTVLGAGVMGLTTAYVLHEAGFKPIIIADNFGRESTSYKAGGQWCPSLVSPEESEQSKSQFQQILRDSHKKFSELGEPWGIFHRLNYVEGLTAPSFSKVPSGVLAKPIVRERFPVQNLSFGGLEYSTILIEPPFFLDQIKKDLVQRKVEFRVMKIESVNQVKQIGSKAIVNCLGLAAGALFEDSSVIPLRGHLVHLEPQDLGYLLSHENGYVFPRRDCLVVGGSVERGVADTEPNESACKEILGRNRAVFE